MWNVVAAMFNQGSTFVANLLLANILATEAFGRYGAIQVSFAAIAAAVQLSAWLSAAHFAARYRDAETEKLGRILYVIRAVVGIVAGVVAVGIVVFRNHYAAAVLHEANAGAEVGLAAAYILFTGLNSYQVGVLVGLDSLRGYAKSSVTQGTAAVGLLVVGAYTGDVSGALLGLSLASLVRFALTERLVSAALARANIPLRRDQLRSALSELMRFSIPASINGLTYMASLWFIVNSIVRQPDGLVLSALYVVCMNVKTLVLFVPQQANNASIAYLTRYRAAFPADYGGAIFWNMMVLIGLTALSAVVVAAAAEPLLRLYGENFTVARTLLRIMMLAAVTEAIGYSMTQHFASRGAMWSVFFAGSLPRDATVIVGVACLLDSGGLEAVAWVLAASWIAYSAGLSLLALSAWRRRSRS